MFIVVTGHAVVRMLMTFRHFSFILKSLINIFLAIEKINRENGTTVLLVEQSANIAMKNSNYTYVLQVGKIAVEGTSKELYEKKEVVNSYLGIKH